MTDAGEWKPFTEPWYTALETLLGANACKQLGFYVIPDDMRLSVVIPIYNEEETLWDLVERVRAVHIRKQLVLVDDCSSDGTGEILEKIVAELRDDEENQVVVERHSVNLGKGPLCEMVSPGPPETSSWSRMPTWNITLRSTRG